MSARGFSLVELLVAVAVLGTSATVALLALGHTLRAGSADAHTNRQLLEAEESVGLLSAEDGVEAREPSERWGRELWETLTREERQRLTVVFAPAEDALIERWDLMPVEDAP